MKKFSILALLAIFSIGCDSTPEPDSQYCERVAIYNLTKATNNPQGHKDYLNHCEAPQTQLDPWMQEELLLQFKELDGE